MSSFLPAALGIAGGVIAPELMPGMAAAGSMLPGAIGSGVGTAAGGLASGQSPTQAMLAGAGSGLGSYALGNLGAGKTLMGGTPGSGLPPAQQAAMNQMGYNITGLPANNVNFPSPAASAPQNGAMNLWGAMPGNSNLMGAAGGALGGYLGGQLGATPKSNQPNLPPGFNTPMTPLNQLPSAQTQLGQNTSKQPMPNFNGFNPFTNNSGAYNFYPGATSGA